MAPKSPWKAVKNGPSQPNAAAQSAERSIEEVGILPKGTTDYEEQQNEEQLVLQAIYIDDYEEVETKSAWSKHSDRAFRLRLKAADNDEISVVLFVKLTATYPKTSPSITLERPLGLRNKTQKTIEKLLKSKPKELLGEVMIHDIAEAVKDVLQDEATFKEKGQALPSLEQERVDKEAEVTKLAKEQEKEELRRKEEEKAEEDRVLQQMVEAEMQKRRDMKRKSRNLTTVMNTQGKLHI
jgi:translation initiation factor 2-alpha kinase 4